MTTKITPEGFQIAESYLLNKSSAELVAKELNLPLDEVHTQLSKREVINYIDRIFHESGFRNKQRMADVWDSVLNAKLLELEETGMGSNKDIVEILEKMHKFNTDTLKLEIELQKAQDGGPAVVVNQQTNHNYNSLLDKILNAKDVN